MNLVQQHNKIDFWVDRVRVPRLTRSMRDEALNTAIDQYVRDRFDNIKKTTKYGFELVERVREELYSILVDDLPLALTGNRSTVPNDFFLHVITYTTINGVRRHSDLITYQKSDMDDNAFTQASADYPFQRRTSTGFSHSYGSTTGLTQVELTYLKNPIQVLWNENPITASALALVVGGFYYVLTGPVTHNGVTYQTGQFFTAVNTVLTNTGTVNLLTNTDMPSSTHEELCKLAGSIIMTIYGGNQQAAALEAQANKS